MLTTHFEENGHGPLQKALEKSQVGAQVVSCDHFRIHGGLAVETEYIIFVYPTEQESFASFALSKTYNAFRSYAHQLERVVEEHHRDSDVSSASENMMKYCRLVKQLIESQRTRYLGKVNFMYVKVMAKERRRILDSVLEATIKDFPTQEQIRTFEVVRKVALIMQTFFLTDHCVLDAETLLKTDASIPDKLRKKSSIDSNTSAPGKGNLLKQPFHWIGEKVATAIPKKDDSSSSSMPKASLANTSVVPISYRTRRSVLQRECDETELATIAGDEARLMVDDDRPATALVPSYSNPVPVVRAQAKWGKVVDNNPLVFFVIAAVAIWILSKAALVQVRLDGDVCLLLIFATFCVGLHTPRPLVGGFDLPPSMVGAVVQHDKSGRELLSRAMSFQSSPKEEVDTEESTDAHSEETSSPMTKLPPESPAVGKYVNSWSDPDASDFDVRGPNYLNDRKKVPSGDYLFASRGIELLLTDACPENVAKNPRIFNGKLRDKPTFIINFRLPWGVLLFYFEIPDRYLPYIRAAHDSIAEKEKEKLTNSLTDMPAGERTLCRFLMNDQEHKNRTLKILPVVIDGPWVVRRVVGGKPAIIGNKMPVQYHYGRATEDKKAYLEADLDIAASAAARGILSVARSYTQILTLNLGFVIQGNQEDELPEQMLVGIRLHGIDPLSAPAFPSLMPHHDNDFLLDQDVDDDADSVTPVGH